MHGHVQASQTVSVRDAQTATYLTACISLDSDRDAETATYLTARIFPNSDNAVLMRVQTRHAVWLSTREYCGPYLIVPQAAKRCTVTTGLALHKQRSGVGPAVGIPSIVGSAVRI